MVAAPKILIVIPVYNHAATLRMVTQQALAQGLPVLIVDDGSTDGSLGTVADLPVEHCRLPHNRGKGAAILAGAAVAQRLGLQAILTIDADGQHDPADAGLLVDYTASTWPAIIIGARLMATDNVPAASLFGRDFSNFWVRLECGRTLADTQSGYRLYPVEFLTSRSFLARRYGFEVEVLVRGAWAGLPILSTEVNVFYAPPGKRISHFHKFKDNLRLSCLHTFLVLRSLLPWPHRRIIPREPRPEPTRVQVSPLDFFRRLTREHSSAGQLAAAVFVGIFIGALPIIPFGVITTVYVTHRLHLNKLAAVGAGNVCMAPFVPLICIELGYFFRHGRFWTEFNRHTLLTEIPFRLWEWLLGALVVGTLLGLLGGVMTYLLVRFLRRRISATANG